MLLAVQIPVTSVVDVAVLSAAGVFTPGLLTKFECQHEARVVRRLGKIQPEDMSSVEILVVWVDLQPEL